MDVERLISLVQRQPCLWDTKCHQYLDRARKDQAWEEVAQGLYGERWLQMRRAERLDKIKKMRTRWASTRDAFRRDIREKGNYGDGTKKKRPYLYTKELQFLLPVLGLPETVDNPEDTEENEGSQPMPDVEASPSTAEESMEPWPRSASQGSMESSAEEEEDLQAPRGRRAGGRAQRGRRGRSAGSEDLSVHALLQYLQSRRQETPEEIMLRGLALHLARVPKRLQLRCMITILNVLQIYTLDENPIELEQMVERYKNNLLRPPSPPAPQQEPYIAHHSGA